MRTTRLVLPTIVLLAAVLAGCDDPTSPIRRTSIDASARAGASELVVTTAADFANHLSWPDNVTNESGWEVHRSTTGASGAFTLLVSLGFANRTSYSDEGLTAATQYCYKVRSFRNSGKNRSFATFSSVACATTFALAAPSNVSAVPGTAFQEPWVSAIAFSWTDQSSSEDGFRIERSGSVTGPWTMLATVGANVSSYSDPAIQLEQFTCYRVRAFNTSGESAPSSVACTAAPRSPGGVVARSLDAGSITVTWTDGSMVEDGYQVERALADGAWSAAPDLVANTTTYRDTSVTPEVRYWYRVRAKKDGGFSRYSSTANAVATGSPPLAPTNLTGVPWENYGEQLTYVHLQWTPQSSNQEGFRLERSPDGNSGWQLLYTLTQTGGSVSAPKEQLFCYRVVAFNGLGDSPPSNVVCTALPATPTNLTATATADFSAIDLAWQDNSAIEDGYQVLRVYCDEYAETCSYSPHATLPANTTSFRDQEIAGQQSITYVVVALRDGGTSTQSNMATGYTVPPPAAPTNLTASAVTATRIDLSWTGTGDSFVERCTGTAATCANGNYEGLQWTSGSFFSDPWVTANTTYTYRVYAYVNGQFSQPSATATATTPTQP